MFPQFYQNHLEKQLKPAEYLTLKILVYLLQSHRQVSIELLASFMPYPIQFESRRRSLQRFLKLDCLNIESLWFPLVKEILKAKFKKSKPLKLAIALYGARTTYLCSAWSGKNEASPYTGDY